MKKILLFLVVAITMASCEGKMGPMGPEGPQGEIGEKGDPGEGSQWHTETFTIKAEDWILKGQQGELNSFYYADVKIPTLTDRIFDEGTVIGYISTAENVKNGLPFVIHAGDQVDGKTQLWTQTYDFDFEPGWIRFYATFSDFQTQITPRGETFHIILMW